MDNEASQICVDEASHAQPRFLDIFDDEATIDDNVRLPDMDCDIIPDAVVEKPTKKRVLPFGGDKATTLVKKVRSKLESSSKSRPESSSTFAASSTSSPTRIPTLKLATSDITKPTTPVSKPVIISPVRRSSPVVADRAAVSMDSVDPFAAFTEDAKNEIMAKVQSALPKFEDALKNYYCACVLRDVTKKLRASILGREIHSTVEYDLEKTALEHTVDNVLKDL